MRLRCLGIDSSLSAPDTRKAITSKVGGSATGVVEEDVHQNAADRDVEPDWQRHPRQPPVAVEPGERHAMLARCPCPSWRRACSAGRKCWRPRCSVTRRSAPCAITSWRFTGRRCSPRPSAGFCGTSSLLDRPRWQCRCAYRTATRPRSRLRVRGCGPTRPRRRGLPCLSGHRRRSLPPDARGVCG